MSDFPELIPNKTLEAINNRNMGGQLFNEATIMQQRQDIRLLMDENHKLRVYMRHLRATLADIHKDYDI